MRGAQGRNRGAEWAWGEGRRGGGNPNHSLETKFTAALSTGRPPAPPNQPLLFGLGGDIMAMGPSLPTPKEGEDGRQAGNLRPRKVGLHAAPRGGSQPPGVPPPAPSQLPGVPRTPAGSRGWGSAGLPSLLPGPAPEPAQERKHMTACPGPRGNSLGMSECGRQAALLLPLLCFS